MKAVALPASIALAIALSCLPAPANAETVITTLHGYEEVPSVSSAARGSFRAFLDDRFGRIEYELRYDGLEGTVTEAHLHIGQRHVNGGVSLFLCGPDPMGVSPNCAPGNSGIVRGAVAFDSVFGPTAQGITPGEIEEVIAAIRAGVAYVNVHTTRFPNGEIRGQLRRFSRF